MNNKNSDMRSRIVQSPDRIKRNIVEMNRQYADLKKQEATIQKKIRDLVSRQQVINDLELVSRQRSPYCGTRRLTAHLRNVLTAEFELVDRARKRRSTRSQGNGRCTTRDQHIEGQVASEED
jgi:hypothetical protein